MVARLHAVADWIAFYDILGRQHAGNALLRSTSAALCPGLGLPLRLPAAAVFRCVRWPRVCRAAFPSNTWAVSALPLPPVISVTDGKATLHYGLSHMLFIATPEEGSHEWNA
jgi:hypothetical protein